MNLANPFKKKAIKQTAAVVVDPAEMPPPTDLTGYLRRGWAFHSRQNEPAAEGDFHSALALNGDSVDAHYGLGLSFKAQGRKTDAVSAFEKALNLLDSGKIEDRIRAQMLRRLVLGHVNELTLGDWNLEKEIWHHAS